MTAALNEYAQEWADRLAHTNSFHHRSQRSFGENLFMATGMNVNGKFIRVLKKYSNLSCLL